jgi:ureidoglycolate hydrolase
VTDEPVNDRSVHGVDAHPVSERAWAPFGWLPRPNTDPGDGEHTLHFEWGDAHLNTIVHTTDEIDATARGLRCAVMYRHETHTQALTPLDAPAVVAVAPPDAPFDAPSDLDAIHAFVLEPGQTVVLHQGTWHWGPYPMWGAASVRLLNVQGRRYAEDNGSVDLTARTGAIVEVVVPDVTSRRRARTNSHT